MKMGNGPKMRLELTTIDHINFVRFPLWMESMHFWGLWQKEIFYCHGLPMIATMNGNGNVKRWENKKLHLFTEATYQFNWKLGRKMDSFSLKRVRERKNDDEKKNTLANLWNWFQSAFKCCWRLKINWDLHKDAMQVRVASCKWRFEKQRIEKSLIIFINSLLFMQNLLYKRYIQSKNYVYDNTEHSVFQKFWQKIIQEMLLV